MKNKFFKFLALSLAATLLPGTTVCADDSSDYVHVDVFGSVYYGTLTTARMAKVLFLLLFQVLAFLCQLLHFLLQSFPIPSKFFHSRR